MNLDDFRCMRQGRQLSMLTEDSAALLNPIAIRNGKKERALLLLHGFSSSPAVFRRLLPFFSTYDAIIAPVLPGHAANLEAFAHCKAQEWLACVEGQATGLLQEFQHLDVLGLSLGGVLACHLGTRFPLRHLYLLAPALDLHLAIHKSIRWAEWFSFLGFQKLRSLAGNLYSKDFCEIAYRQLPLSTIAEILNFIQGFSFEAPLCPTDVFLGRHDEVVASNLVAKRFDKTACQIHWLENSAHVLPLDGDAFAIGEWVKKHI